MNPPAPRVPVNLEPDNSPPEVWIAREEQVLAWGNAVIWTGHSWRTFQRGDLRGRFTREHTPDDPRPYIICAQRIHGRGELDPSIWVVTTAPYKGIVHAMHKRFRGAKR